MSQRYRPSLSQTAALAEPTLSQLAAPPSATRSLGKRQQAQARQVAFIERERAKARAMSRPPAKIEPTSAAPTPERAAKDPLKMEMVLHAGGQISHDTRVWMDEYGHHVPDDLLPAYELLMAAWEIACRVRMISSRAYTGAPYTGVGPDHEGHVAMTERDRRDMEVFAYAMEHLTAHEPQWWELLRTHFLRETQTSASGRIPGMAEVGARLTKYKPRTDNSRSAGVTALIMALIRWREAVQAGAVKFQYARLRRQALHQEAATRWVDDRRERLAQTRKALKG